MYSSETSITQNIEELQSDILLDDLDDNELFKASSIEMLNKALNTKKKNIIAAVNELQIAIDTLSSTTMQSLNQQYEMIGDFKSNPELVDEIQKIDGNLSLALLKTNSEVNAVKETISKTVKDIVFVLPKAIPDTCKPEIYFPYRGNLKRITANLCSTADKEKEVDVIVALERFNEATDKWVEIVRVQIDQDKNYVLKNITEEDTGNMYIDNVPLRVHVVQSELGLTDLTVVATVEVNS